MGCDIHLHIEIKNKGEWIHYNSPRIPRIYALFTMMAGVRQEYGCNVEIVALPRGLPPDISLTTKLDRTYYGQAGHSDSWLNVEEIEKVERWWRTTQGELNPIIRFPDVFGYLYGGTLGGFNVFRESYPDWLEDVRVVFWFDN